MRAPWTRRRQCPASPAATVSKCGVPGDRSSSLGCKMRCAVCRCLRGARRSASTIASMKGCAGASFGRSRSGLFRSGGNALAKARRTSRRCTPNFRATSRIVSGAMFVLPPNLLV
jgi:hypothetical protein